MTTESGSDSESKDKEQDQQESPAQQGAVETQPQDQQQQQLSEEHQNALEQFSAVAAHSTPVKKEQVREPARACLLHAPISWEIMSLVYYERKYIFRYTCKAAWCDAVDLVGLLRLKNNSSHAECFEIHVRSFCLRCLNVRAVLLTKQETSSILHLH